VGREGVRGREEWGSKGVKVREDWWEV